MTTIDNIKDFTNFISTVGLKDLSIKDMEIVIETIKKLNSIKLLMPLKNVPS